MFKIELEYNPYLVESRLSINNEEVLEGPVIAFIKNKRMGMWVEAFFPELIERVNAKDIEFYFRGIRQDYEDLEEEAKKYNEKHGTTIKTNYVSLDEVEPLKKIKKLEELAAKAQQSPVERLNGNNLQNKLERTLEKTFEIGVIATMSSGKSTLINAILGQDLLPAANAATTAMITRITNDYEAKKFTGNAYGFDNEAICPENIELSLEKLKEWNIESIKEVHINGSMPGIESKELKLVLVDTPGPNVPNEHHKEVTLRLLKDESKPLIMFVIDLTKDLTTDNENLLRYLADAMKDGGKQAQDRILFVANRVDELDPEKGEDISGAIDKIEAYLGKFGIQNPRIIPVSALLTKLKRHQNAGGALSKQEAAKLNYLQELFLSDENMRILEHVKLSPSLERKLRKKIADAQSRNDNMQLAELYSGIPILEAVIEEYVNKYGITQKIFQAASELKKHVGVESELKELRGSLLEDEERRESVHTQLKNIQEKLKIGEEATEFKKRVQNLEWRKTDSYSNKINTIRNDYQSKLKDINSKAVTQELDIDAARIVIDALKTKSMDAAQKLKSSFETLIEEIQKEQLAHILNDYRAYYQRLTGGMKELEVLVNVAQLEFALSTDELLLPEDMYVHIKPVRVGTKKVSNVKWYNPLTWFSDDSYEAVYDEKKVIKIGKVTFDLIAKLAAHLEDQQDRLEQHLKILIKALAEDCADKMDEFDQKVQELVNSLAQETENQKTLEDNIQNKKSMEQWLEEFSQELETCLAV